MTNLSSSFPSGAAGVGLLVLRLSLASRLLAEGLAIVWGGNVAGRVLLLLGVSLLLCGVFVAAGFLTRVVQIAVAVIVVGVVSYRLSVVQDPTTIYDWQLWAFELATAVSLALIGPGWYSIDARLFGRREIVFETRTDH
jgi:uncharacterized membrane protein YphA (DoxX/SURF4 family)